MAVIPPTNLPTIIGKIISFATPAVKPRWSPKTKEAETAKAILIIFLDYPCLLTFGTWEYC